jgi:hypothetical protein
LSELLLEAEADAEADAEEEEEAAEEALAFKDDAEADNDVVVSCELDVFLDSEDLLSEELLELFFEESDFELLLSFFEPLFLFLFLFACEVCFERETSTVLVTTSTRSTTTVWTTSRMICSTIIFYDQLCQLLPLYMKRE